MSIFGGGGGGGSSAASYYATIIHKVGSVTYIAKAAPGSATASSVWQAMKLDQSVTPNLLTWADGNASFDNVATDLTTLTYS